MTGEVVNILETNGYFFVRGEDGIEYFAHKTALKLSRWEDLVIGHRVEFDPDPHNARGPRTERVQRLDVSLA